MKIALLALLLAANLSSAQTTPNGPETYRYFRVGAPTNIQTHPRAGYALMGGGADLDEALLTIHISRACATSTPSRPW